MRAIFVEVPQDVLDHRRRTGIDRYDEMWEGVLHMAPAPRIHHQAIVAAVIAALTHATRGRDLLVVDGINVCDPENHKGNYRVPDLCVLDPDTPAVGDDFGRASGIHLAAEIRSPNDETYDKLAFYAERGVEELLIVDMHLGVVRSLRLDGGGDYAETTIDGVAVTHYGVTVAIDGDRCVVTWADGIVQRV